MTIILSLMKGCFYALIFLFLITGVATAQKTLDPTYFSISYFGILGTHPGVKVGIQYPVATLNKQLDKQLNQIVAAANVLFYYHRRNQLGLGFTTEVGFRNKRYEGLNKEVFAGLGYLRTFIPNVVYDFDAAGQGVKRQFVGTGHLLKTIAIGLGRNVDSASDANFWMIKPTLMHIKPFNTGSTLNFALDAGYHFN